MIKEMKLGPFGFCNRRITGTYDAILFSISKSKDGKFLNLVVPYLMFVTDNPFYKKS